MKNMTLFLTTMFLSLTVLVPKERNVENNDASTIMHNDNEYQINRAIPQNINPSSRDIIYSDDFEGEDIEWTYDSGWQLTESDYNTPSHSFNSPNDASTQNGSWNLLSPMISLPQIGPDDNINFGFHLYNNQVDSDGDGDNFLEDYYSVSMMDPGELAWHASTFNAYEGMSYWCGKEDVDGYLDSWLQYLDTPSITIPSSGYSLKAQMAWGLEDPAGATVAGSCTDGWDAANVRISTDGGATWDLLTGTDSYDFNCGYGWIWNDAGYESGGELNHLAPGWGGQSDWHEVTFNLNSYAGEEVIVRFAFGSDPAYSTPDDPTLTGFRVDNIIIESSTDELFSDDADGVSEMIASGAVWVDQFYDYWDDGSLGGGVRPGSLGWEEYLPGLPFNGNVFLDITEYAGKDVIFRIQSRYDENDDGGQGLGLFIDDFKIYLPSSAAYAPPTGLTGEGLDGSCELQWNDMTASGTEDFIYDNDGFSGYSIYMNSGVGYAGETFEIVGPSVVNTIQIYNSESNTIPTQTEISGYGLFGSLYNTEPIYTEAVSLTQAGWNEISLAGHEWSFDGKFIIAYQISDVVNGELDDTAVPSVHSMFRSSGSWRTWLEDSGDLSDGEWGIRANITYDGVDATYNVYRDMAQISSGLTVNNYMDTDVVNNDTYTYAVSATYSDGEESNLSETVTLTPQAQTVYELAWDDGTSEMGFNAGGGNYTAVQFTAAGNDPLIRLKWFQVGDGGAFYLKMWADAGGLPSNEIFSTIVSGGVDGWNTKEMMEEQMTLSGTFWVGAKEFSSTNPFGMDTNSDLGNSYFQIGSGGWEPIANSGLSGNLMFRASLDNPGGGGSTVTVNVDHMADWNLVGLPVGVDDTNHMSVFPDAIEGTCYSFGNGYELQDDLASGNGYWLRFPESGSNGITGESLSSVSTTLMTDWNLVSGPSDQISVDDTYDPEALIIPGTYYGFGNGYELTETLEPGKGYWVRSTGDGSVSFGGMGLSRTITPLNAELENANIISINGADLYFGVDIPEETKLSYSLPPKPPTGSFDVRFAGDWKVAHEMGTIDIMNSSELIHIHYNVVDEDMWILHDPLAQRDYILSGSGEIQISGHSESLILSKNNKNDAPNVFALNPAYPNPFNPSTQISYFVPAESMIDISVYDISGRLVETLVSELKNYGKHSIMWNASSQASGVYFVRIKTEGFTDVQKIILTK